MLEPDFRHGKSVNRKRICLDQTRPPSIGEVEERLGVGISLLPIQGMGEPQCGTLQQRLVLRPRAHV